VSTPTSKVARVVRLHTAVAYFPVYSIKRLVLFKANMYFVCGPALRLIPQNQLLLFDHRAFEVLNQN